jgi:hypothetical protein
MADLKGPSGLAVGLAAGTMISAGSNGESRAVWARPEAIATDVCTQRRKGEQWMTTRKRLRLRAVRDEDAEEDDSASSLACSR